MKTNGLHGENAQKNGRRGSREPFTLFTALKNVGRCAAFRRGAATHRREWKSEMFYDYERKRTRNRTKCSGRDGEANRIYKTIENLRRQRKRF